MTVLQVKDLRKTFGSIVAVENINFDINFFANGIRDSMVYGIGLLNVDYWINIGILAA